LAIAQLESIHTLEHQTPAYKEFLSAALHEVAQMTGSHPLTPETTKTPITFWILKVAVASYSFTLNTEAEHLSTAAPGIQCLSVGIIESEHLSMADPQISTMIIPQTQNVTTASMWL
jgi:hypothetical protein